MYVTVLGALLGVTCGVSPTNTWSVEFCSQLHEKTFCCLDVAFMCARKLPIRRAVPACGALLDNLLHVAGIALLQADLSAQPRHELFATDASPSAAGACIANVTPELWRSLHRISEKKRRTRAT